MEDNVMSDIRLREATEDDCDLLFEWTNDEVVRKNSFSTHRIEYEDHVKWFDKLLYDNNRIQLILERKTGNHVEAIGQIRLDIDFEKCLAEIGYSIDSDYSDMGYEKQIIYLSGKYIEQEYPNISKLVGKVKPNNVASLKAFEDTGFENVYSKLECDVHRIGLKATNIFLTGGILFLTNNVNSLCLYDWLAERCKVILISDPITSSDIERIKPNLVISYNYIHIVKPDVIEVMSGRIINMHISYLPWNRGANPNFWSFVENTPKGVTIHVMDKGLDTGDILYQKEIFFDETKETFSSTYDSLHKEIVELFKNHWDDIYDGNIHPRRQLGKGSYHSISDFRKVCDCLDFTWDDLVARVKENYEKIDEK